MMKYCHFSHDGNNQGHVSVQCAVSTRLLRTSLEQCIGMLSINATKRQNSEDSKDKAAKNHGQGVTSDTVSSVLAFQFPEQC